MNLTQKASTRKAFGKTLIKLAAKNRNIYVVNANLVSALFLKKFRQRFPSRFIECGVAENNAAGVAAGLAKAGKIVFLTSFSCFSPAINWATIRQSICYNNLPVKIIGSHSGLLSSTLGATHQMLCDIALTRCLPNMEVFAPLDAQETKLITQTIACSRKPAYLRLVRPDTPCFYNYQRKFTIGKNDILQKGKDLTVLGYGSVLLQAFDIKDKSVEIINCASIKPLDEETIIKSAKKTKNVIVIEDHQKNGGLGEAVASILLSRGVFCKFKHIAVDDKFGQSGQPDELYEFYNLNLKKYV
jgi:transketolase